MLHTPVRQSQSVALKQCVTYFNLLFFANEAKRFRVMEDREVWRLNLQLLPLQPSRKSSNDFFGGWGVLKIFQKVGVCVVGVY